MNDAGGKADAQSEVWRPRVLIWFDTEFSSLELEKAKLLQVAALATDLKLNRLLPAEEDVRLAVRLGRHTPVSAWAAENLAGLLMQCRSGDAVSEGEADRRLSDYVACALRAAGPLETEQAVLAGNSIHADWWLARRWLPAFGRRLHYRHLDVSALKIEWLARGGEPFEKDNPSTLRAWFPQARVDAGAQQHDALYDVQASIAELAYYRARLMACPGP